jgi:hypothetical protein
VEPTPLVGAEVQRIRAAFQAASLELSAALTAMSEAGVDRLGTPTSERAVADGLADLRTTLERFQATADACVAATGRHVGGTDPAGPPRSGPRDAG